MPIPPPLKVINIDYADRTHVGRVILVSTSLQDTSLLLNVIHLETRSLELRRRRIKTVAKQRELVCVALEEIGSTTSPVVKEEQDLLDPELAETENFDGDTQERYDILKVNMKYIVSMYATISKDFMKTPSDATERNVVEGM